MSFRKTPLSGGENVYVNKCSTNHTNEYANLGNTLLKQLKASYYKIVVTKYK